MSEQLPSKPNTYEVIGITHARYAGRDFYGERASDMAELAYLRDWKRWGESEFQTLMRNHSADIAQHERPAHETPPRSLTNEQVRTLFAPLPPAEAEAFRQSGVGYPDETSSVDSAFAVRAAELLAYIENGMTYGMGRISLDTVKIALRKCIGIPDQANELNGSEQG